MAQTIAERLATPDVYTVRPRVGLQRLVAGWAAFGITLSGATQLRIGGLPVGPSEFILAAWIAFVGFLLLRGVRFAPSRAFAVLGGYWLAQLAILGFGAAIAVHLRRFHLEDAIHDSLAFVYMGTLSTLLCLRLFETDAYEYRWTFARLIFVFHALAGGLLLIVALAIPAVGPVRFWYGGVRFAGWSENPNQLALAMVAMPFLGWWLMRRTSGLFSKAAYLGGIALCVAAGLATKSDGMRVAWIASLGAVFTLLLYRVVMRGRSRWLHISHVILPALVVVVGVSFGADIVEHLSHVADDVYSEGDQGEKRFTLWFHGFQAIQELPLVGFGPGPFSGYDGPFEGREAHNSFIDWGMSTGAIGLALYLGLLAWTARCALRSGDTMPVAMLIAVVFCSVFGYMLRQPDFWTIVVLVLMLSEGSGRMRGPQASPLVLAHDGDPSRLTVRFEENRVQ